MRHIITSVILAIGVSMTAFAVATGAPAVKSKSTTANGIDWSKYNGSIRHEYERPWGILLYYGWMSDKLLNQILRFQYNVRSARLYSIDFSYGLKPTNFLNTLFGWTGAATQLALNLTYQDDPVGNIYEVNPYFDLRWSHFPWNKFVYTTLAVGEGVSYASSIPARELRDDHAKINGKRFENYLMFEVTFSLPKHPEWQLVYRIHHRSGAFGLYNSTNSGSTAFGVGVRYLFK